MIMQITFYDSSGQILYVRDDMESGAWHEHEFNVNMVFPFDAEKPISRGMRLSFPAPSTGDIQFFEIRNVQNIEPDAYQQITAEHIAVSELSDDHINAVEISGKTPLEALTTVLSGTLWQPGNMGVNTAQNADFSRGSVWQTLAVISSNWNCHTIPRVTVANGVITGRYIDVVPAEGTFRGLRLSIRRNMSDSAVTYDDTNVATALYGYGGSVNVPQSGGRPDERQELTFAGVVWSATADHPAKPAGQLYIEDPAKTAIYGRNGRPRWGYYQNSDIKDAEILLQKTWEALKATSEPVISITGTVADWYRMGYADVPVRLWDKAIIDVIDTGETFVKQIIQNDVDLCDPTATVPVVGDYIPNIIYINRETNERASGRGGGGARGQTNEQHKDGELFAEFRQTSQMVGMVVGTYNGGYKIDAGRIALAINDEGSNAYIEANHVMVNGETVLTTALEDIRTEVYSAESGIYTAINQTASYVAIEMGRKSSVFFRYTNPLNDPTVEVHENDVWIESNLINSYSDSEQFTWSELAEYSWLDYYGANVYAYKNGVWEPVAGNQLANYNFEQTKFTNESVNFIRGDLTGLYSQFYQEKGQIRTYVQERSNNLHSEILQTASEIRLSVTNTASELRGEISVQADRVSLVVQGTGSNARIRPAQIVAAINAQTGTSTVLLSADKVKIDGDVNLSDVISINSGVGYAVMKKWTLFDNDVWVRTGISLLDGSVGYGITAQTLATTIKSASVSGSTLTLTTYSGSTINFSKPSAPTISNSSTDIYTSSSWPSGATDLSRLVTQFNKAKADGDNLIFRVHVGDTVKLFGCTP